MPVPLKVRDRGVAPPAASLTVRLALRAPAAAGLNAASIEQEAPAASVAAAQPLLVMTKLAGLAPPSVTLLTVIDPMPVFVYVKVWAAVCVPTVALPNAVVPVSVAAAATPVPVRAMLCAVAPGTLSVTVRVPARAPVVFGLKATSMRQVALGARVAATQRSAPESPRHSRCS